MCRMPSDVTLFYNSLMNHDFLCSFFSAALLIFSANRSPSFLQSHRNRLGKADAAALSLDLRTGFIS